MHMVPVRGAASLTPTATDGGGKLAPMSWPLVSSSPRIVADIQVSSYSQLGPSVPPPV